MTKFYSIILAAAVTLSASAENKVYELKTFDQKKETTFKSTGKVVKGLKKVAELDGTTLSPKNLQEDGTYSIEGIYDFYVGDYYLGDEDADPEYIIEVTVKAGASANQYTIYDTSGLSVFMEPVNFTYNETNGSVTFALEKKGRVQLGDGSYAYYSFSPTQWTGSSIAVLSSLIVPFDKTTGEFGFELDYGFGWGAYSDSGYRTHLGWFGLFDVLGMAQTGDIEAIDEVQEGQWKYVGMASFIDGYITPGYTMGGQAIDAKKYEIEVELQQNVDNEHLYRLWKPYTNGKHLLTPNNLSSNEGQIVFDVSNPNHVVVLACGMPSGFQNPNGEFYLSNELGWYINMLGGNYFRDKDEYEYYKNLVINILYTQDGIESSDTFKDRVVTINKPMFDYDDMHSSGYGWNSPQTAYITFPKTDGVENIVATEGEGTVEYYNLQGVRVSSPAAGQLVIKKQGNNVSKVLVK